MTCSPARAALRTAYYAERLDQYDAAQQAGAPMREGFPTPERVQEWRREWAALVERERCPKCGLCGEFLRVGEAGTVLRCREHGEYAVSLGGAK